MFHESIIQERNLGALSLYGLSDKAIYVFTLYSLKGLCDVCLEDSPTRSRQP